MINPKKLIKIARKWQKVAALRRKRISLPRRGNTQSNKGHFAGYSADRRRFEFPIVYLDNDVIRELLEMAEEEFGVSSNGPIVLPCETVLMEYVDSLIQKGVDSDMEKTLLISIANSRCSS